MATWISAFPAGLGLQRLLLPIIGRLEELRKRLVYSVLSVAAGFLVGFHEQQRIIAFLQRPFDDALARVHLSASLVYMNPTDPFNLSLKTSLIAGLFIASPALSYQVWAFIAPALGKRTRHGMVQFMLSTVGLFLSGAAFAYYLLCPAALEFFIYFGRQFVPRITLKEYLDFLTAMVLGVSAAFEVPVVIYYLALVGFVSAPGMLRTFRYAVLGIFVVAGAICPTPDVWNMCLFAAPMFLLYLASIVVAHFVHPSRRTRSAA